MAEDADPILDAITQLLPRLLAVLDRLGHVARHMHPPDLRALIGTLDGQEALLAEARERFRAPAWPGGLAGFRDQLDEAAAHAQRALEGLRLALSAENGMVGAYRAMRHLPRALEALYPLTSVLPTISEYYLEASRQGDAALLARLGERRDKTGVFHAANDTRERGGFSVYVPEYNDPAVPAPLIMALHGGAGHGRLFLWTWLREARSRGAILVAPTATGDTWSLMDPPVDTANFGRILNEVSRACALDPTRMLLTGMSDGGTFTLLAGLEEESPFTHLAPVAASFHPMLLAMTEPARIRNLPVMLTHGALDWMFPVSVGRTAQRALKAAGAAVEYREIDDLSHAYPRDENSGIMDWFLDGTGG